MNTIEFKEVFNYDPKSRDKKQNEAFRNERISHSKEYREISSFATGVSYYKYFPIETAITCLENETMAFVEPSRWNDAYESLYYEADYSEVSKKYEDYPRVFATCATNQKYDEPAWRIYSGEDNICVQFELDRFQFRYAILKSLKDNDSIYEGTVQYASKFIIESIGQRTRTNPKTGVVSNNKFYDEFIAHKGKPFCVNNYLNLLLKKRKDFEHEQEGREFPRSQTSQPGKRDSFHGSASVDRESGQGRTEKESTPFSGTDKTGCRSVSSVAIGWDRRKGLCCTGILSQRRD